MSGSGAEAADDGGRTAFRIAAALHVLLGLAFGVGSPPVLVYYARNGELPLSPFGWRYMAGPVEQLGPLPFMALGWTLVAVCALDVVAGRWLWQGRRHGLQLGKPRRSRPMMSLPATTAVALILGFAAIASGALMYWLRGGLQGGAPPSRRYLVWERSFIMAAVVLTAAGLVLLADLLAAADGAAVARAGAVGYLFGGVLVVAAEASSLGRGLHQDWPAESWSLAVVYVVLALLAQAAIGGALLAGDVLPVWIGWGTLAWNIGWLAFYVLRRGDIYIPFVHHVMPFVIGLAVLLQPA